VEAIKVVEVVKGVREASKGEDVCGEVDSSSAEQ